MRSALSLEAAAAPGRHFPRPARGRGVPAAATWRSRPGRCVPPPATGGGRAAAEGLQSSGVRGSPSLVSVKHFCYPNS